MGLIRYLLIKPWRISRIIWDDVIQDDFNWPTIIERKIKTINLSNEKTSDVPDIEIGDWLFVSKINDQIWYSIKRPENIANRPIKALPLYSNALIQLILNIEKYLDNYFFRLIYLSGSWKKLLIVSSTGKSSKLILSAS